MASRLTKYLKQKAEFKAVVRDENGDPQLNVYGEPSYTFGAMIPCRKEPYKALNTGEAGLVITANHTYYLDNTVQPRVEDMLDGNTIKDVIDYVDGMGTLVGYEVRV